MPTNDYAFAQEKYAGLNVDTEEALARLATVPLSMHCWQGDDVGGFEQSGHGTRRRGLPSRVTIPGKARTLAELRADLDKRVSRSSPASTG